MMSGAVVIRMPVTYHKPLGIDLIDWHIIKIEGFKGFWSLVTGDPMDVA